MRCEWIKYALVVALAATLSGHALAEWRDKNGNPTPDTADRRSAGEFGAQILLSNDGEQFIKDWAIPGEGVHLRTSDRTVINHPITAFVIFAGCTADAAGNCRLSLRFTVIQPDGNIYAESQPFPVWDNKPAPQAHILHLCKQSMSIRIEPHEQLGRYFVIATLRDEHAKTDLSLEKAFTVEAAVPTANQSATAAP